MFSIGSTPWSRDALIEAMPEFLRMWSRRPWDANPGGMGATHMFFTWFTVRQLDPQYIVESGVLHGAGTWMLEQAAPAAKLFCIDTRRKRPSIYASRRAHYQRKDFSKTVWGALDKERTLLFFDDHQDWHRIQHAKASGFQHVIYEDNDPIDIGVLTVKAALAQQAEPAEWLMANVETYYEFPPIFANRSKGPFLYDQFSDVTHPPLFDERDPAFQPFVDNAGGYYYMAYLKIKKGRP